MSIFGGLVRRFVRVADRTGAPKKEITRTQVDLIEPFLKGETPKGFFQP